MKQITKTITSELQALSNAEKREIFPKFFKAGKENMEKATAS